MMGVVTRRVCRLACGRRCGRPSLPWVWSTPNMLSLIHTLLLRKTTSVIIWLLSYLLVCTLPVQVHYRYLQCGRTSALR